MLMEELLSELNFVPEMNATMGSHTETNLKLAAFGDKNTRHVITLHLVVSEYLYLYI